MFQDVLRTNLVLVLVASIAAGGKHCFLAIGHFFREAIINDAERKTGSRLMITESVSDFFSNVNPTGEHPAVKQSSLCWTSLIANPAKRKVDPCLTATQCGGGVPLPGNLTFLSLPLASGHVSALEMFLSSDARASNAQKF